MTAAEQHLLYWNADEGRWQSSRIILLADRPAAIAAFRGRYEELSDQMTRIEMAGNIALMVVPKIGARFVIGGFRGGAVMLRSGPRAVGGRMLRQSGRAPQVLLTEIEGSLWAQAIRRTLSGRHQRGNVAIAMSELEGNLEASWAVGGGARNPRGSVRAVDLSTPGVTADAANRVFDAERTARYGGIPHHYCIHR